MLLCVCVCMFMCVCMCVFGVLLCVCKFVKMIWANRAFVFLIILFRCYYSKFLSSTQILLLFYLLILFTYFIIGKEIIFPITNLCGAKKFSSRSLFFFQNKGGEGLCLNMQFNGNCHIFSTDIITLVFVLDTYNKCNSVIYNYQNNPALLHILLLAATPLEASGGQVNPLLGRL